MENAKHVATERHGKLTCDIEVREPQKCYVGILKRNAFEIGRINGSNLSQIRSQFQIVADLNEEGAMVRHGIIMLGYHNNILRGDVLLVDGEFLGAWHMDDLEWCHFSTGAEDKIECSAPSPWMLHDSIAKWFERMPEG